MKIISFNEPNLKRFRSDFKAAVAELEAESGISLDLGNISFDADQFTTKLTVTIIAEGENPRVAIQKKSLNDFGIRYGLTDADHERRFNFNGKSFAIIGVKSRRQKYPIIAREISTGREFKLPARAII